ncbi:subclass B3 metallo-beta-lactamase [Parvularcula lutaonensis]|uniref:Subclass B3 metallo-beta-lactamase n=1 Tax=Parvularcula lutaonensis TaxID=491923 RepID=A0ABV7MED5_9PROT|nr:subclass B3 metallo-beta-lactamase [Parvularcula lutaonensis]GGY55043.1 CAU/MBL1b family subclass B3 metallo-beta-lactamase [Parvularcula lutaonensis]
MRKIFIALGGLALPVLGTCGTKTFDTEARSPLNDWAATCEDWDDWDKPGPAFTIHGNTHYVGTCGIGAFLVAGDQGHILIDGGPKNGGPLIAANIEELGFSVDDVKIILHTHEHHDHVGGLAELKVASGARVIASKAAAPVLERGQVGVDDPQSAVHEAFAPVAVSSTVRDGETVTLGALSLTAIATPGHTPGALSWQWASCADGDCKTIVVMDSLSAVSAEGYRFSEHPEVVASFQDSIERVSGLDCDVPLTPHPSASGMRERILQRGELAIPDGCRAYAAKVGDALERRLAKEKANE